MVSLQLETECLINPHKIVCSLFSDFKLIVVGLHFCSYGQDVQDCGHLVDRRLRDDSDINRKLRTCLLE